MIGIEDSQYTYEYKDYFKILPSINNWFEDSKELKMEKRYRQTSPIQVITIKIG